MVIRILEVLRISSLVHPFIQMKFEERNKLFTNRTLRPIWNKGKNGGIPEKPCRKIFYKPLCNKGFGSYKSYEIPMEWLVP